MHCACDLTWAEINLKRHRIALDGPEVKPFWLMHLYVCAHDELKKPHPSAPCYCPCIHVAVSRTGASNEVTWGQEHCSMPLTLRLTSTLWMCNFGKEKKQCGSNSVLKSNFLSWITISNKMLKLWRSVECGVCALSQCETMNPKNAQKQSSSLFQPLQLLAVMQFPESPNVQKQTST